MRHEATSKTIFSALKLIGGGLVFFALASCGLVDALKVNKSAMPAAIQAGSSVTQSAGQSGPQVARPRFETETPSALEISVIARSTGGSVTRVAVNATYSDGAEEDVTQYVTFSEASGEPQLVEVNKSGEIRYRVAGTAELKAALVGVESEALKVSASHASPTNPAVAFTSSTGSSVFVDTGLSCRASGSVDPEGTAVSYRFSWSGISGTPVRVTGTGGSVTETYVVKGADRGNFISCSVAAEDSAADALPSHRVSGGQAVQARDRAPSRPEATIDFAFGTQFKVGGQIRCRATGSIDPDGDDVRYEIRWVNTSSGQVTHEANGQETYTITEADVGKALACEARATSDIPAAAESSSWASSARSIELAELPPVVTSLVFQHLIPDPSTLPPNTTVAYPGDVLVCTAEGYDPNGLTVRWGLAGETITRTRIFEIDASMRGRSITCVAQLVNSAGLRSELLQRTITIGNRPPAEPTVAIGSSSSTVIPGSTLTCMGTTTDPDGDVPLIQNISWSGIAGTVDPSAVNMYTVTQADTGPISCRVTFCDIWPYKSLTECKTVKNLQSPINWLSCCGGVSDAGSSSIALGNFSQPNTPLVSSFAAGLSSTSGKGKITGIWTSGDGATPPVATSGYLVVAYPSTMTWSPTDGGVYTTGQVLANNTVYVGYAGAGLNGATIGGPANTLGAQFEVPYGRYRYALFARGINGRYSNRASGELTVGVTIKAVGPSAQLVRAERDSVYWDLVYDGAATITLTAANITPYGSPIGITTGSPTVTVINSTTRRVTFSNLLGAGTLRFSVAANTAQSVSGNALALSSFYVTPVHVEMKNIAPTDPVVTLNYNSGVLTCVATSSDANGDAITYSRVWKRNGVAIAGKTGETYAISLDDENANIQCEATAADGYLLSAAVTSSAYAVNAFCSNFTSTTPADAILGYPDVAYNASSNPYLLCNPAQVTSIADGCGVTTAGVVSNSLCSKSFKLQQNIDMSSVTWSNKMIGAADSQGNNLAFSGTIDGAGFAIRGLTINRDTNITGYTSACTGFLGRLTGTLKNLSLDRLTVTSSTGPAAAIVCDSAVSSSTSLSSVRTSAVVTSPSSASALRRVSGTGTLGEKLDISGVFTSTGTTSSNSAGIFADPTGYSRAKINKVSAFVTGVGTGAPGLAPGQDSILIGSGFSQQTVNNTDGSHTSLFGSWYPSGDITYYTNPASAEITRQLAVSRALFYNPYSGAPIVKYNQGAVYDTNAPGLASVSCFTQSAGGGTSYNSYPLRQVSASVFAGLNHPVMHAIENPFGASGSTLVYNCASPYANIPRTP
ncbi:hypothetical protein EBZ80_20095, partial [bacterium]|nr:hypothetical protein [bacterium]